MVDLSPFAVTGTNSGGKQVSVTYQNSLLAALESGINAASGGSGLSALFTDLGGSTIAAPVVALDSAGYDTDGIGSARYIYDADVNADYIDANPRTAFLAADGRGFKLDPLQRLTIEMFGGKADWNGTGGTDNLAPLMAAVSYKPDATLNFSGTVHLGIGKYWFSDTFEPRTSCHIVGSGRGQDGSSVVGFDGTFCYWPNTKTCIRNPESNTIGEGAGSAPSASGSIYENFCIAHTAMGADLTKHGVHLRARATLRNLTFLDISGNGTHIDCTAGSGGATEGNVNNWRSHGCFVKSCGGTGLYVHGNDANAGLCTGFETKECGGCGILDRSGLGNTYIGHNIAGYGNGGVHYGGRHYQLLGPEGDASLGSSTTPGTSNSVWYDIGVGGVSANYPTWVNGTVYRHMMPFAAFGYSNRSTFWGGYTEFGSGILSHVESPAMAFGGQNGLTSVSCAPFASTITSPLYCSTGIGGYKTSIPGTALAADMGSGQFTALGTTDQNGPEYSPNILEHRRTKDGDFSWHWRWAGNNQVYGFLNAKPAWTITGPSTATTFGRSTAQPHYMGFSDFALIDPTDAGNSRIHGIRIAAPTTGYHARGEVVWNVNPSAAGVLGWSCTTAGTPGTWTAIPVVGFTGSYAADATFLASLTVGSVAADDSSLKVANTSGYEFHARFNANTSTFYTDIYKAGVGYGWHNQRASVFNFMVDGADTVEIVTAGLGLAAGKVLKVGGTQVVGARGAAVADATDAASAITQLNALLARCRAHGLIA